MENPTVTTNMTHKWEFCQNKAWFGYDDGDTSILETAHFRNLGSCELPVKQRVVNLHDMEDVDVHGNRAPFAVRRRLRVKDLSTPEYLYYWEDGNRGSEDWKGYSPLVCLELEAAAAAGVPRLFLAVADFNDKPNRYYVDLQKMIQVNKRTLYTRRVLKLHKSSPIPAVTAAAADSAGAPNPSDTKVTLEDTACPVFPVMDIKVCSECGEQSADLVRLGICKEGHYFHKECISDLVCVDPSYVIRCPVCQATFGNQPAGQLNIVTDNEIRLAGYEDVGAIHITYQHPSGIQTAIHPEPGRKFTGVGWNAYLPNNHEGQLVAKMLETAWHRKVIYRVGISAAYGVDAGYRVVWNGIPHKTNYTGQFGYPDPTYLTTVTAELAKFGITPESVM